MTVESPSPDEPLRQQAARPWRLLVVLGVLAVSLAFFTVGYTACDNPRANADMEVGLLVVTAAFCPLLLGLLGIALGHVVRGPSLTSFCSGVLTAFAMLYAICLLTIGCAGCMGAIFKASLFSWGEVIVTLLVGLVGAVMLLGLHRIWSDVPSFRRASQLSFFVALPTAVCAGLLATLFRFSLFANLLWIGGSVLMLLGCAGESVALTRRSWPGTLWCLCRCRLADAAVEPGICPGCGYNLYGLSEKRCPECGRAFTFEEVGVTSEEMSFARSQDDSTGRRKV